MVSFGMTTIIQVLVRPAEQPIFLLKCSIIAKSFVGVLNPLERIYNINKRIYNIDSDQLGCDWSIGVLDFSPPDRTTTQCSSIKYVIRRNLGNIFKDGVVL